MRALALFAILAFGAFAEAGHEAKTEGEHGKSSETLWKIANFAILAGGIGYLIGKNAPAFFRSRTEEIQKGIREAAALRDEAEAKSADIEQRMKNLAAEIDQIRKTAADEFTREGERIHAENARQIARVQEQAQQEISSVAKSARQELKAFSADLSIQLAAERIRSQMNPETQRATLDDFVRDLENHRSGTEVH